MMLGFAVQLVTIRYLGTFLNDPLDVSAEVVDYVAEQLGIMAIGFMSMEINRGAVAMWSGAVCGGAAALAGVVATAEGRAWRPVVIGLIALAGIALIVLLWTALQPVLFWMREWSWRRHHPRAERGSGGEAAQAQRRREEAAQKRRQEREAKLRPLYTDLITVLRETNKLLFQLGATLSDPSAREQADALTEAVTDRMSRIDALTTEADIDGSKDAREIAAKLMAGVSGISGEIEAAVPFTFESIAEARAAMVVAERALVSVARKEFGEVDDTTGPAAVNRGGELGQEEMTNARIGTPATTSHTLPLDPA